MGIINHDSLSFNGLSIQNTYICISTNVIRVQLDKSVDPVGYNIDIDYCTFASLESKNNNFPPLMNNGLNLSVSSLPGDLYEYGYQQLKALYPNYSDC